MDLYAGKIREALTGAIDTGKLAEAWALLHPGMMSKAGRWAATSRVSQPSAAQHGAPPDAFRPVPVSNPPRLAGASVAKDVDPAAWALLHPGVFTAKGVMLGERSGSTGDMGRGGTPTRLADPARFGASPGPGPIPGGNSQGVRGAKRGVSPTGMVSKDVDPALSAFLARAAQALRAALSAILRKLWPEAWVLGQQAAQAAVTGDPVDWAGWTPADVAAAEQIAGEGLQRLLADADITIKSIAASRVSELADVLEATLASDVTHVPPLPEPLPPVNSVGSLAKALTAVLDDPGRARMVAHTEIARAQSAAALDQYRSLDVGTKGWLTAEDAKVCPQCDADEAAGDIPLGDRFPSGNDAPPGHPICRCALMPGLARAA